MVKKIWVSDGPLGFYKGLCPALVSAIPTRALTFWAYNVSKERLSAGLGDGPLNHLTSAFAAGLLTNTLTNPIWMVKTRFQLIADTSKGQQQFKTYNEVIRAIWKEGGLPAFFRGLSASYVGCFDKGIQWVLYEQAKRAADVHIDVLRKDGAANVERQQAAEYFLAAALSKAVAISATYPYNVVRTRLRESAQMGVLKYTSFFQALALIAKEEGRRGLYGGMGLHMLRSVPNNAVMFASFEILTQLLEKAYKARVTA